MEVILVVFVILITICLGITEKKKNDKNISSIQMRVNVNGIRGKSTITRMITSVISEAGVNTLGKTTGTAPRIITNQEKNEYEVKRLPRGVSISEQLDVIDFAASKKVDALVCECMAVNPIYQVVYQDKMIQANVGIIVNVLEDHMDLMGPTLDEVALAFLSTIPKNGILIVSDSEYNDFFKKHARKRNTKIFIADESDIPDGYIEKFDYMVFPNNIAIPLAFARAVGIDKDIALRGMLKANSDPGALRINSLNDGLNKSVFVNAFAANEPTSTIEIWENIFDDNTNLDVPKLDPIVIINGRNDRADRTQQFVDDCISHLGDSIILIGIGESLDIVEEAFESGKFPNVKKFYNYENYSMTTVIEEINKIRNNKVIFCIGNIHGDGEELLIEFGKINPKINIFNHNLETKGGE